MRTSVAAITGLGLLGVGYLLGSMHGSNLIFAGQDEKAPRAEAGKSEKTGGKKDDVPANLAGLSEETQKKLKDAATALKAAHDGLKLENRYKSATKGLNVTGILSGRFDSLRDLESGRGVDPETFVALYANMAEDSVAEKLTHDEEGRLHYRGKLIRMYSIDRLRAMYAARAVVTGEEVPLTEEEKAAKEREAKASGKATAPKAEEKKSGEANGAAKEEKENK